MPAPILGRWPGMPTCGIPGFWSGGCSSPPRCCWAVTAAARPTNPPMTRPGCRGLTGGRRPVAGLAARPPYPSRPNWRARPGCLGAAGGRTTPCLAAQAARYSAPPGTTTRWGRPPRGRRGQQLGGAGRAGVTTDLAATPSNSLTPWYRTKHTPSAADMLAKLRRVLIAAQYRQAQVTAPTRHQQATSPMSSTSSARPTASTRPPAPADLACCAPTQAPAGYHLPAAPVPSADAGSQRFHRIGHLRVMTTATPAPTIPAEPAKHDRSCPCQHCHGPPAQNLGSQKGMTTMRPKWSTVSQLRPNRPLRALSKGAMSSTRPHPRPLRSLILLTLLSATLAEIGRAHV